MKLETSFQIDNTIINDRYTGNITIDQTDDLNPDKILPAWNLFEDLFYIGSYIDIDRTMQFANSRQVTRF
jgi:hypothetical protein